MMKRLAGAAVVLVLGAAVAPVAAVAGQPVPGAAPPMTLKRPDLTVTMQPKVGFYQQPDGTKCVDYRPGTVVVTNVGTAAAAGFDVSLEWNAPGTFQVHSLKPNLTLAPGEAKVFDESQPVSALTWCPGRNQALPAWRVTADSGKKVLESNELNNVVEKHYQPKAARIKKTQPAGPLQQQGVPGPAPVVR